ncbi:MAG: amidohydrolase family protein [Ignisphaera sp.]
MIINVGYALVGKDLEFRKELHIEIVDGLITHIGSGYVSNASLDLRHGIALPGLVNAHIHVLDYAFLEYGIGLKLEDVVAEPHGLKHKLLESLTNDDIAYACKRVFSKLLRSGVTTAIIFSELPWTIKIMKNIAKEVGIRAIVLGRPRRDISVENVIDEADGLGLDSPLRYDKETLNKMNRLCNYKGKLIATHVAETAKAHLRGDFDLAMNYLDADIIVHGTHLKEDELFMLAEKGRSLVVCPRSNMWFGVGLPPIAKALEQNVNILLGTDNAGLIDPDMWRELEITYHLLRLAQSNASAREVLKMATTNIEMVKKLNISNVLEEGAKASITILDARELDIERAKDVYSAIVKRASPMHVIKVIGGW